MKYYTIFLFAFSMLVATLGCQSENKTTPNASADNKLVEEVPTTDKLANSRAQAKRQPVPEMPQDTNALAKLVFDGEPIFNFGKVKEGEKVTHTFHFTNKGNQPLVISRAFSTCGCTVPSYSEEPIPIGGKGEIDVIFNTDGKTGKQEKIVYIHANTFPRDSKATLKGFVKK